MATLNSSPDLVDLVGYAGDTLTVTVTAPTSFIAGRVWAAQIRATAGASGVDATFIITPPTVTDGPATLVLPAAETARLFSSGVGKVYAGVWDCQLAPAGGGDPVTTLAQGRLTIGGDVTRAA
jgi:hypothetical protein